MRRLPPLNALRAFEAAGRHLSFSKAAGELNVTPAAISQQVKLLEEHLGVMLFRRLNRALLLTDDGQICLPALRDGFDRLADAVARIAARREANVLTVSVAPSLAAKWLAPRLDRFYRRHPDFDIRIDATATLADFSSDGVDVAIRYGDGNYPGMRVDCLMTEEVFPVCSPRLTDGADPLSDIGDLARFPLLHIDWAGREDDWPDWRMWLAAAGFPDIDASRGSRFTHTSMAVQAAVDGVGVALGCRSIAADDLAAGRLVKPFDLTLVPDFCHYVVAPERTADRPEIALFRDWILREAGVDPTAATG
ncbi:MAG: transcriptional regulator GcvA [Inquilinus sp.]|nr:transcriptional regulator GcvA [Inquilinus sp.]